jgi:hypothetical protein
MEYDRNEESTQENIVPHPSVAVLSSRSTTKLIPRKISSQSQSGDPIKEEEDEYDHVLDRSDDTPEIARSSPASITRASPVSARINIVVAGTDASAKVDEIAMSPIPMEREDPTTLMELPDNLLTLPISPCGPHDDPWGQKA